MENQHNLSSSDFSVISHPPEEESFVNGPLCFRSPYECEPTLQLDDFRIRLHDLLQENLQLKVALQQNTNLVKQNFETLGAWQEKVTETNRRHKVMLRESGRLIQELHRENHTLRLRIRDLESPTEVNAAEIPDLQQVRSEIIDEQSLVCADDDAAGYTVVHHFPLEAGIQQQQIEDVSGSSNGISLRLQKCKDRLLHVDKMVSNYWGKMEKGVDKAGSSKEGNRTRTSDRQTNDLRQILEQFNGLLEDHKLSLHMLKNTQCEGQQTEALRVIEKRQQQELSDSLTARLVAAQEELNACRGRLEQKEKQLALLHADLEQLPILRAQVEIYRQDFETERQCNERCRSELDKARQEILHNQQPEESIRQSNHRRRQKKTSSTAEQTSVVVGYSCPKCALVFENITALQNHVECCLTDVSSSPYP